ncbi:MAG: GC-type dockerin domain-anchored protein [Phycisphaerales bacterium JB040]
MQIGWTLAALATAQFQPAVEVLELSQGRRGVVFSMPSTNAVGEVAYLSDDIDDALFPEIRFVPAPGLGAPYTLASEATGFRTPKFWIEEPRSVFLNDQSEVVAAGTYSPLGIAQSTYLVFTPSGGVRDATPVTPGVPAVRSLSGGGTINNSGTVAFGQQGEGSSLEAGVFKFRVGLEPFAMVDQGTAPFYYVSDFPVQVTDDGLALFQAFKPRGGTPRPSLVLAGPGPGVYTEIVDGTQSGAVLLTHASASLSGEIAYALQDVFAVVQDIRRWNGGSPETLVRAFGVPLAGVCAVESFMADYERGGFAINGAGDLAFVAETGAHGVGLCLRRADGTGCDDPPLLAIGDTVEGHEWLGPVTGIELGPRAFGGEGLIAARLRFGDEQAIARIRAVPETGCPPDLNDDGVLDQGDIQAFVQLFLSGDPASDLNADGVLDQGDIQAFVGAFVAGC